jgi:hypothetical protein
VSKRNGRTWFEIDELSSAIDFLERLNSFLDEDSDSKWKWAAIAAHGALYGFGILATMGTNPYEKPPEGSGVVTRSTKGDHLIPFRKVIRRIQDPSILREPVVLTPPQVARIEKLREMLRNNFMHFAPRSQSISLDGFPEIFKDAVDIVEHLVLKTPANRGLRENEVEDLQRTINAIRRKLTIL